MPRDPSPNQVNAEICKALGIDISKAVGVEVRLAYGKWPEVLVTRWLNERDEQGVLCQAIERLQLKPALMDEPTEAQSSGWGSGPQVPMSDREAAYRRAVALPGPRELKKMPSIRRERLLIGLSWLLWNCVIQPLCWLCWWPARVWLAVNEAVLAVIFNDAEAATDLRWTAHALRAVYRRAARASGSKRP